jgi:hypothetical protein
MTSYLSFALRNRCCARAAVEQSLHDRALTLTPLFLGRETLAGKTRFADSVSFA